MYVRTYVCMSVCMYVYASVCLCVSVCKPYISICPSLVCACIYICIYIYIHIYIYMCIRMYSRTRAWTSRVNCRVPSLRMKTCVCDVTYIRMYMAIDMPLCLSAFSSHRFCLHLTLSLHPSSTFPLPLIWGFSRSLACSLCLFPLQTNNLIFAPCLSDRLLHRNCVLGCLNVFA